jgi:hypothetical protein
VKKLEKHAPLNELVAHLQKMEESSKVDLAVLKPLDELIGNCRSMEDFWKKDQRVPIQDAFLVYHASRNIRIVLNKMRKRFVEAEEKHENPAVVDESIAVIPPLSELCELIYLMKSKVPTKEMLGLLSAKVEYLRETASFNSLLPTPEEEIQELDKKRLHKCFDEFANTLRATLT